MFLFGVFKIIGIKISRIISEKILTSFGPMFRSKKIILANLTKAFPKLNELEKKQILKQMWVNYGRIFAEYMYIKDFRHGPFRKKIIIENQHILEEVKRDFSPVIFISGHFSNFELMAMEIERFGVDLAAVYRPLNNIFLNPLMENVRKKYICKKQIKKGISGTKELLQNFKKGTSIALMIDQRVSEGISVNLFNEKALTTTIPSQFIKKFGTKIIPVYIERYKVENFKITFHKPLEFPQNLSLDLITSKLNTVLEEMIRKNPGQWIWSHNRWK